jgi:hypothetical protein
VDRNFSGLSKAYTVFKCPKVAEGEAKKLMDRAREVWKIEKEKKVTIVREEKIIEPTQE